MTSASCDASTIIYPAFQPLNICWQNPDEEKEAFQNLLAVLFFAIELVPNIGNLFAIRDTLRRSTRRWMMGCARFIGPMPFPSKKPASSSPSSGSPDLVHVPRNDDVFARVGGAPIRAIARSFLDTPDAVRTRQLSRSWYNLAWTPFEWQYRARHDFGPLVHGSCFKDFVGNQALSWYSSDQRARLRMAVFMHRLCRENIQRWMQLNPPCMVLWLEPFDVLEYLNVGSNATNTPLPPDLVELLQNNKNMQQGSANVHMQRYAETRSMLRPVFESSLHAESIAKDGALTTCFKQAHQVGMFVVIGASIVSYIFGHHLLVYTTTHMCMAMAVVAGAAYWSNRTFFGDIHSLLRIKVCASVWFGCIGLLLLHASYTYLHVVFESVAKIMTTMATPLLFTSIQRISKLVYTVGVTAWVGYFGIASEACSSSEMDDGYYSDGGDEEAQMHWRRRKHLILAAFVLLAGAYAGLSDWSLIVAKCLCIYLVRMVPVAFLADVLYAPRVWYRKNISLPSSPSRLVWAALGSWIFVAVQLLPWFRPNLVSRRNIAAQLTLSLEASSASWIALATLAHAYAFVIWVRD